MSQFFDASFSEKRAATAGGRAQLGLLLMAASRGAPREPTPGHPGREAGPTPRKFPGPEGTAAAEPLGFTLTPQRDGGGGGSSEVSPASSPPPFCPRSPPPTPPLAGSSARPAPSCTASAATRAARTEPPSGPLGEGERVRQRGREAPGGGGGPEGEGRRHERAGRAVGFALTGKRLGGAMGGRAGRRRGLYMGVTMVVWGRGLAGAPRPPKMAAPEALEALAGGSCNRPRHRPDLPPPLLCVCLK